MRREQMADKTGTGDMAMTVQRASKGNLMAGEKIRAEITLPKRGKIGLMMDVHTSLKTKRKKENGEKKKQTMFTLPTPPHTPPNLSFNLTSSYPSKREFFTFYGSIVTQFSTFSLSPFAELYGARRVSQKEFLSIGLNFFRKLTPHICHPIMKL